MENDYLDQLEDASLILEGVEIRFIIRKFVVDAIIAYFVKISSNENISSLSNLDELLCVWLPNALRPSSVAQVEFARDIATALKIEIQSSVLSNRSDCMKFISENLDNYFAISEKNGSPIMN